MLAQLAKVTRDPLVAWSGSDDQAVGDLRRSEAVGNPDLLGEDEFGGGGKGEGFFGFGGEGQALVAGEVHTVWS